MDDPLLATATWAYLTNCPRCGAVTELDPHGARCLLCKWRYEPLALHPILPPPDLPYAPSKPAKTTRAPSSAAGPKPLKPASTVRPVPKPVATRQTPRPRPAVRPAPKPVARPNKPLTGWQVFWIVVLVMAVIGSICHPNGSSGYSSGDSSIPAVTTFTQMCEQMVSGAHLSDYDLERGFGSCPQYASFRAETGSLNQVREQAGETPISYPGAEPGDPPVIP